MNEVSFDESARNRSARNYIIFDPSENQDLADLIQVASEVCGTRMALVTLVDDSTQHHKAKRGLEYNSFTREQAFCRVTIQQPHVLVIEDAQLDSRFSSNPLVTGDPNIRFYAGAPLTNNDGFRIGSLCVIDIEPKVLDAVQVSCLETLARLVMHRMELSLSMRAMRGETVSAEDY